MSFPVIVGYVPSNAETIKKKDSVTTESICGPNHGGVVLPPSRPIQVLICLIILIGKDLRHLFPTDGYVNSKRSDYTLGIVSKVSYESRLIQIITR